MSVMILGLQGRGTGRTRIEVGFGPLGLSKRHLHKPWNNNGAVRSPRIKMVSESTTESTSSTLELENLVSNVAQNSPRDKISNFQTRLNKASKWLVSSATGAVVLWRHDEHALWAFMGAAVSGAVGKTLKYLINDKRPETACGRKRDPGMPSSHAQGFMYLSTYASLGLLTGQGLNLWTISSACALLLTGIYLSWLRVADGLHTIPQIIVGGTLGSAVACFWLWCWKGVTEQALEIHPTAKIYLFAASGLCAVAYFLLSVRKWRFDQY